MALVNGEMNGPLVASGDWHSAIPFPLSGVTVTRDGKASTLAAIQTNDVIYWNQTMRALWVSSDRAVGVIQALTPSAASPESVQIAGRTYPIESASAAYALSDLGQYGVGDTVTLLLGRTGGVAAVAAPSAAQTERCGVVVRTERGSYDDGHGGSYTADTVTILSTDGSTYSYPWTANYLEAGDPVGISIGSDGKVTLKRLSSPALSGKVSADGLKLGTHTIAPDAEILDAAGGNAVKIFPSRLAGMELTSGKVAYYSLNGSGEIDRMVLNNATGDAYRYGVLTHMESLGEGLYSSYSYEYDVGGTSYSISSTSTRYPVQTGPILVDGDPAAPDRILPLTSVKADKISGGTLVSGSRQYLLADEVIVYERRDKDYFLSTLDRVQELGLSFTGWYDRAENQGGRIRVIVAQ